MVYSFKYRRAHLCKLSLRYCLRASCGVKIKRTKKMILQEIIYLLIDHQTADTCVFAKSDTGDIGWRLEVVELNNQNFLLTDEENENILFDSKDSVMKFSVEKLGIGMIFFASKNAANKLPV